jgi:hypothetical protein
MYAMFGQFPRPYPQNPDYADTLGPESSHTLLRCNRGTVVSLGLVASAFVCDSTQTIDPNIEVHSLF